MIKVYSIAMALVCLFATPAAAQEPKPVTRPAERTIVLDISMIEVNLNRTEDLERIAKDKTRLDSLIAEGKARPVASLQIRTRSGEQATARIGQRVPIQTATLPAFTAPSERRKRVVGQPSGVESGGPMVANAGVFPTGGIPQIRYENTGLVVEALPGILANGEIEVRVNLEMTGLDRSTGNFTPTFVQRSVSDFIRVKPGETTMLMGLIQHESLWPSQAQSSPPQAADQSRGSFIVLFTARLLD